MVMTTFLHDGELYQPSGNSEIDELLTEVRTATSCNYQVVARRFDQRHGFLWLRKRTVLRMGVYLEVGGIGPWQVFGCTRDEKTVIAFLLGLLNGISHANQSGRESTP